MEQNHFSHNHGLVFHELAQGSEMECSGCRSSCSGNVYVCWQCGYFLHEQCFRATRSIDHASHPLHPLTLVPYPTYHSAAFICNRCNLVGQGFSYACSKCEFDLHVHCALLHDDSNSPESIPSSIIKHFSHPHVLVAKEMDEELGEILLCSGCEIELCGSVYVCTESQCSFALHENCFSAPLELRHASHLQHPLKLLTSPPNGDEAFTCKACLKQGKAFAYSCSACSYVLHLDCVTWPVSMTRRDHRHNLTLYYTSPLEKNETIICDVCENPVHETAWIYYCRQCRFGTHLECVVMPSPETQGSISIQEEAMIKQFELQLAINNISFANQAFNAASQFSSQLFRSAYDSL